MATTLKMFVESAVFLAVKYIDVNSTFRMKEDYFVMFQRSIRLVFNARMCKQDCVPAVDRGAVHVLPTLLHVYL